MVTEQLIAEHLDVWASAIKPGAANGRGRGGSSGSGRTELYGMEKLRELILELAVRGLLVPQDPNDEPASELIKRIETHKTKLVEEGKVKKQAELPKIRSEEEVFALPKQWEWVKLGNLMEMYNGRAFKQSEWTTTGIPIVRIQNLNDESASFNFYEGELEDRHKIDDGSFLISWSGTPGTSFGAFIWDRGPGALNQHINNCLVFGEESNKEYLKLAVSSCMEHLIANAQGGVGLKHVTKGTLNNVVFALPPLQEQSRIVAKVGELLSLCDQLQQETERSVNAHQLLVETLLYALTNAADQGSFEQAWQRIAEHFDTLFTTEHSVDQLKQTILQLAVTGRLVDFSEDVLKGELKEFLTFGPRNGLSPKESPSETPVKVLKLGATSYGRLDLSQTKCVDIDVAKESHLWLKEGDILIQRGNSANFVGVNVLIKEDIDSVIYPDLMMKLRVKENVNPLYISIWLASPGSRKHMWDRMTGTSGTMPKISKKVVESIPVIVPDLETQGKIVSTVDSLFRICGELTPAILCAQDLQIKLADILSKAKTLGRG